VTGPTDLIALWRSQGKFLEDSAVSVGAAISYRHAEELQEWWRIHQTETLTLAQAAMETGYTADALSKQIRRGALPNLGSKSRPRVRRCDLPRKAGNLDIRKLETAEPDLAGSVLRAHESGSHNVTAP
jgi:hypothetical protein